MKQREKKFRAWDKKNKVFVYGELLKGCPMSLTSHSPDLLGSEMEDWQQYTGLKDKTAKEIYEGDVVKEWHTNYEVQFNDGAFRFKGSGVKDGHILSPKLIEIIGNIYENPELLQEDIFHGAGGKCPVEMCKDCFEIDNR